MKRGRMIDRIKKRIQGMLAVEREIIMKPDLLEIRMPCTVLVIAPHSDDEVLGCGGLLNVIRNGGGRLNFLIVTNGRSGTAFTDLTGEELSRMREQETRAAADLLQVEECLFLNEEDTRVCNTKSFRQDIKQALDVVRPEVVLLPYIYDAHTDHRATTEAALQVLQDDRYSVQVLMYEVWTPLPANKVIHIDWEYKAELIQRYKSQLGESAFYIDGTKSLARYRAMTAMNDPDGYAECFLEWSLKKNTYLIDTCE